MTVKEERSLPAGAAASTRQSVITCPHCGVSKSETMPTDACQFYYDCTCCGALLRPKQGDCCVFCSYGSVPCPPIQEAGCASGDCRSGS
jgi:hypothetical protein